MSTIKAWRYFFILSTFLIFGCYTFARSEPKSTSGCGEQCIKLLCKFYNIDVSDGVIKNLLNPTEFGESSFRDIERCVRKIGLDCYAFKGNIQELKQVKYPVILHFRVEKNKINHFLVSLLSKENQLIGYDPTFSAKPFNLTTQKLNRYWTGVGLAVFPKQKKTYNLWVIFVIIIVSMLLGSCFALSSNIAKTYERRRNK